jgi:hypothetical protein
MQKDVKTLKNIDIKGYKKLYKNVFGEEAKNNRGD